MNEQQLAEEAYLLFEEWFAKPYRESCRVGPVGPMHGTDEQRRRALLVHHYLVRRGLTVPAGSASRFRISERGQDLAYREHEVRRLLGIPLARGAAYPSPEDIRAHAKSIFNEHFRTGDRGLNFIPRDDLDVEAAELLARRKLLQKTRSGSYMLGERGDEIRMGELDLEEALAPAAGAGSPIAVTNNFHAPVGAVATAPGAVAHGTIQILAVDQALHQLVELQDTLGELTDLLFPLLRRVRQGGIRGTSEEELQREIAEAEEFKAFQAAVKSGIWNDSLDAVKQVVGLFGAMKPVLHLLG